MALDSALTPFGHSGCKDGGELRCKPRGQLVFQAKLEGKRKGIRKDPEDLAREMEFLQRNGF